MLLSRAYLFSTIGSCRYIEQSMAQRGQRLCHVKGHSLFYFPNANLCFNTIAMEMEANTDCPNGRFH